LTQISARNEAAVAFESLAPWLIRKEVKKQGLSKHNLAKINSYYFALLQATALNGKNNSNGLLAEFSGIPENRQKWYRDFLEGIGLIEVEEEIENGVTKHCYIIKRVPFQDFYESGNIEEKDSLDDEKESNMTGCEEENVSDGRIDHREKSSSVGKTDEKNSQRNTVAGRIDHHKVDSKAFLSSYSSKLEYSDRVSLKDWSRRQITQFHYKNPDSPPEGAKPEQAVACAMSTTPGFDGFLKSVGGFSKFWPRLVKLIYRPYRGVAIRYKHWMDGALAFSRIPFPKGRAPSIEYYFAAVANKAQHSMADDVIRQHEKFKSGYRELEVGERLLPKEKLAYIIEQTRRSLSIHDPAE